MKGDGEHVTNHTAGNPSCQTLRWATLIAMSATLAGCGLRQTPISLTVPVEVTREVTRQVTVTAAATAPLTLSVILERTLVTQATSGQDFELPACPRATFYFETSGEGRLEASLWNSGTGERIGDIVDVNGAASGQVSYAVEAGYYYFQVEPTTNQAYIEARCED
jgi:hypothetical protein